MFNFIENFIDKYYSNMSILTLRYKEQKDEQAYKKELAFFKLLQMRFAPLITTFFYISFMLLDTYVATTDQLKSAQLFHGSMIFFLVLPSIFSFFSSMKKMMFYTLAFAPIFAAFGNIYLLYIGIDVYISDIYLILIWVFIMAGFFVYEAIIINTIITFFILLTFFFVPILEPSVLVIHIIYITITWAIGFFAVYIIEFSSRKHFETNLILNNAKLDIEKAHKNINDSIEYASLIQHALLPSKDILEKYFNDGFIFWQPKDKVGGDIYFITELDSKEEVVVMVIDGAGHGVPGAFVTMLVKAIETQIIADISNDKLEPSPALILEYFNRSIKTMLKQEKGSRSNAGFDGGILYYNKATNECKYAGAKTPLYIIDDDKLEVLKSDRKNVGFVRTKITQKYTEYDITIKENTQLYIATDGIVDQEGLNDTRYGKKEFERMLLKTSIKSMDKQKDEIINIFKEYKKDLEQSDDVTVVGLKF